MAKIQIIDSQDGARTPFMRGILTRSLHEAGLAFDEAYDLASSIRQELDDAQEVSTEDLRCRVIERLESKYAPEIASNYSAPPGTPVTIIVRDYDGQTNPFSRSQHQRALESCGLSSEDAMLATTRVHRELMLLGLTKIGTGQLGRITYQCLHQSFGEQAAQRYKMWVEYTHSGRPLLFLIGGTTGCGKSTIASEIAHRLGIVRIQSTDLLREVMRMMIPQRLMPVLHESSFNAWKAIQVPANADEATDANLAAGFRSQAELLAVTCEAVIQRALRERVSLILEGIHVHPALLERIPKHTDAVIVPIMLAVLKKKSLQNRLRGRGLDMPERSTKRHMENFDAIWRLQSLLLSEADQSQVPVPIIANEDKDKAVRMALGTIIDTLSRDFTSTLDEVFR